MAAFYFPQDESELFQRYSDCLDNFISQYGYCLRKQEILNVINKGENGDTRTLLQYFGFLSKTIHDALDLLAWADRATYEFENITYASKMYFSEPCVLHARSLYEEKIVTSYASPTFLPECVSLKCDLCYAFNDNSDSCPNYV